jgi:hypothetical protein
MDRRKYFDKQLVTAEDLNAAVTNTYNAIGNLMSDIGIFGIISGGVVTEQGTPSMSVDMTGPFIGYTQIGERVYRSTSAVIDCSVDYLGNPTVPTTPGEARWISLHGRFDYTLQDAKVIDGNTEYLTWAESYEWRVVSGTAAASPTHTKPAKPADAILITDIELVFGQTTILNADIDDTRRDDFVFAAATAISVSSGAWTKLDNTAANVQDAFDSADNELISRSVLGEIDESIFPDGPTRDLGSSSKVWGDVHGTIFTAYTSILASANGKLFGSPDERFEAYLNTATIYTKLAAAAGGEVIGDSSNRFDAHLNTATIYTKLAAAAGGEVIGDSSNQFDAHLSSVLLYGAIADRLKFSAAKTVTLKVPIHDFLSVAGTDWAWNSTRAYISCNTTPKTAQIKFNALHGADIHEVRIRWAQASSTAMTAQLFKVDEDNAETSVGAAKSITTIDGSTNWDTIATGYAETVDLNTNYYRVNVVTAAAVVHNVYMLEVTYNVTDALLAALYRS